jgi:hypothetical protein
VMEMDPDVITTMDNLIVLAKRMSDNLPSPAAGVSSTFKSARDDFGHILFLITSDYEDPATITRLIALVEVGLIECLASVEMVCVMDVGFLPVCMLFKART